jgi:hypothetical protein
MPYLELKTLLEMDGDEVEEGGEDTSELRTKKGKRYVRSNEGNKDAPKWRWSRW